MDTSGFGIVRAHVATWDRYSSLEQIRDAWQGTPGRLLGWIDEVLGEGSTREKVAEACCMRASVLNFLGDPQGAYQCLERARAAVTPSPAASARWLFPIIHFQGVTALRCAEDDNCVHCACRSACSCILPFDATAIHTRPEGSRLAIHHFEEYLLQFPTDLEVRWLLNVAHMTTGTQDRVEPGSRLVPGHLDTHGVDIGRFRDVAQAVGIQRLNQAGGAVMEDFDGDGLLDLALTSFDVAQPMVVYRNRGDGTFEDRSTRSGVGDQLGGLNCVQTDYDNDGDTDLFVIRGAWLSSPIRCSLLRNDGTGAFEDVTEASGLLDPVNSNAAQWADYDNDGWLDLFVACEKQANRLYRNLGNGTFEECAAAAGVAGSGGFHKGAAWIDFDNDRYPDLFVTDLDGSARLFQNDRKGHFRDATAGMGIDGPRAGFSCWAWDYDNDGWQDIFATCYQRTLADVVRGLIGEPRIGAEASRLFRNLEGRGFEDVATEAGLDAVYATMGSNYADFDNDGYLDMYLATGDPQLSTLIPNRMFKGVEGKRFAEVTGSSGTGHLQKGHGVACGDWDRDGDVDLFVQLGGAVPGDRFHNVLFENPGHGRHALTVRLIGTKSNRAAIGARIKAVPAGEPGRAICRHVASGSSFGANTLEQTIGLGTSTRVARLEVYWPTSDTTQVFLDVAADQVIRITELATDYQAFPLGQVASAR